MTNYDASKLSPEPIKKAAQAIGAVTEAHISTKLNRGENNASPFQTLQIQADTARKLFNSALDSHRRSDDPSPERNERELFPGISGATTNLDFTNTTTDRNLMKYKN